MIPEFECEVDECDCDRAVECRNARLVIPWGLVDHSPPTAIDWGPVPRGAWREWYPAPSRVGRQPGRPGLGKHGRQITAREWRGIQRRWLQARRKAGRR